MKQIALTIVFLLLLGSCRSDAPPEPLPSAPEPAAPTAGSVASFDGADVYYTRYGAGDDAVVLVHCWACEQSFWENQIGDLALEHTVVTIDLPGHGQSDAAREDWNNINYARDVAAVVNALELDRVVLVGHSMGGAVSVEAAKLLGGKVVGVVPVDTLHDFDFDWGQVGWTGIVDRLAADFAAGCPQFVGSMFTETSPKHVIEDVQTRMCSIDETVGLALLRAFPDHDVVSTIRELDVPIRAINAPGFPTDAEGNREISDYGVVIMQDVGHFPMLERPDRFTEILSRVVADLFAGTTTYPQAGTDAGSGNSPGT